uniref:Uncharacterized protein n=1 Tax=Caenorhabditis japonica TaxID=281687 RepID=A0A8R1IGL6_CAEJA
MDKKRDDTSESDSDNNSNVSSTSIGEALQTCTDGEWDASDEPYSAELLNVKKKPNRVNVFSATEKNLETVLVAEESLTNVSVTTPSTARRPEYHNLARVIQKACAVLLESSSGEGAEVQIKLEFEDWRNNP